MLRLLSPRGTGTGLRRGRIPPDVLFGKNERTMDEKNPCPVDWRLFRPASQYSRNTARSLEERNDKELEYISHLALSRPLRRTFATAIAISSFVGGGGVGDVVICFPLHDGGGACTGRGRGVGCWCRNQRRWAKTVFFLALNNRAFMEPIQRKKAALESVHPTNQTSTT